MTTNTTIQIAAGIARKLNEHGIDWTITAGSTGLVRLHAARGGYLPANPCSPYAIGAHTLSLAELDDEYAGPADDPDSVKLTPDDQTEVKVEALVIVPTADGGQTTEISTIQHWRLSHVLAATELWLARVVEVETQQQEAGLPAKHWSPVFDEATQKFFVQLDGSPVVVGAFYATQEMAQTQADRLNARPSTK